MMGWAKTNGAAVVTRTDHGEIRASDWDSKIYRQITLAPGHYVLYGAGKGDVMVFLQENWAKPPFAYLNLSSGDWRTDYRDFEAPGGPVLMVVQANGPQAVAKIQWLKVESAPLAPAEGVPEVSALKKERPSPPIVRGFQTGVINSPYCGLRNANYFGDVRAWGANAVRLQIVPVHHANGAGKEFWAAWPSCLDSVEASVKQARHAGVKVIPVLMQGPPVFNLKGEAVKGETTEWWNHAEVRKGYCRLWKDLATRLLPYRDTIWAYDLMNEPLDRQQLPWPPRQWRPLAVEIIRTIRDVDPNVWIVYETGPGSMFRGFEGLVPLPDPQVIYGAHFYYPQEFTHQGISDIRGTDLAEAMKKINVRYPSLINGVRYDKAQLAEILKPADEFQAKWQAPIYVGEFSVIRWAPKDDAARWLRDVVDLFEARGWSWTYHAFREFDGWSLEHDETFRRMGDDPAPNTVADETERAKIVKKALRKNWGDIQ